MNLADLLPAEGGRFIGRIHDPQVGHPIPVLAAEGTVWDLSRLADTVADLLAEPELSGLLDTAQTGPARWTTAEVSADEADLGHRPTLLAPIDLQVIKACGVTFAGSMLERVIEERAGGDPRAAQAIRAELAAELPVDLSGVVPGSPEAARIKAILQERGWWSQYLEVGLGPDPEVFTKGPVLSAVGSGWDIGIPRFSSWNNPEPELVLVLDPAGRLVGATLGNDVNLRDVEGRSALLLGMAKDNNRSTSIGPMIRLFDASFAVDAARESVITLTVTGEDGTRLEGVNSVSALSRSFEELIGAARGDHHQYPDGFVLFTGTLFAPTQDRDAPGQGFTHHLGDAVEICSAELGALRSTVRRTEELPAWDYGLRSLLRDLHRARASR